MKFMSCTKGNSLFRPQKT